MNLMRLNQRKTASPLVEPRDGETSQSTSTRKEMVKSGVLLLSLIIANFTLIVFVYSQLPPLSMSMSQSGVEESLFSILPTNVEELKQFRQLLLEYTHQNFQHMLLLFCLVYLFKQTYSIPGSIFMNILGGALFGLWISFPLCCMLTAVGASLCFGLSLCVAGPLVKIFMPDRLKSLQKRIETIDKGSLLPYLLFIRMFPFTPNWFINLASPLIHVPFGHFFLSILIGLIPYNFVTTNAGTLVQELDSLSDVMDLTTALKIGTISVLFLLSAFIQQYLKRKEKVV